MRRPTSPTTPRLTALPFLAFTMLPAVASAQQPRCLSGWSERVSGEILPYHSAQEPEDQALLVRSLDAERFIEWDTAPVPLDETGDFATFVWLFGIDVNGETHEWQLEVDGEPCLTFENPSRTALDPWTVEGQDGASLLFRPTFVDRYEDLFGYAFLRVPRAMYTPGESLRLKVVGESAQSRVWYMTAMRAVEESVRLVAPNALLRGSEGEEHRRPLSLQVVRLAEETDVTVRTSLGTEQAAHLSFGSNELELALPRLTGGQEITVELEYPSGAVQELTSEIEPVRPWLVYLVQHTHTDIGYTRPQTEILPEHLRYLDYALDYCDATDAYPADARFRWTCETSWAVREYLLSRPPEQLERLRRRVLEGRIELTAMFFNVSEVMDESTYTDFLQPVRDFHDAGLPVVTAFQNDINGAAWCLADWFAPIGVRYLVMGQHSHRALKPFDLPTSFWWESPAGSRVLAFRADHYMTGNFWGVHTGSVETVERSLFGYLRNLEQKGYPFERVAVQYSGYLTDNSPPSTAGNELIRAWNEKYVWPRLRSATAGELPRWVEEHHGEELPVERAAWPDWWTDGFGSAPRESAAARLTQSEMTATEGLLAMEVALGDELPASFLDDARRIRESLIFYGEHTFGAAESIRDPLCTNSLVQWAEKAAYAWDAVKESALLREKALGRFQAYVTSSDVPVLVVANTLGFPRTAVAEAYVDHQVLPAGASFRIVDDEGVEVVAQRRRSREDGSYWSFLVPDVPALGYRTFRIEVEDDVARPSAPVDPGTTRLESLWYRVDVDPETGALLSLYDLELGRELLDPAAEWPAGTVVHETLGNREQLEAFTLTRYERVAPTEVRVVERRHGPLWDSLTLAADLPCGSEPGALRVELRLYHEVKRLELHYSIRKRRSFDPEGLYVAFPFAPEGGHLVYETLGGIANPATDLLEGSASDWQAVQDFTAARYPDGQVLLCTPEIPLAHHGAINLGGFRRVHEVKEPHVFSWVMNNYWTTNFKASVEGELSWSYALTSTADTSNAAAARFGQSCRIPLPARVPPAGAERSPTASRSLPALEPANLQPVSAHPARHGGGVVLLVREVDGVATEGRLLAGDEPVTGLGVVDVLESELETDGGPLQLRPYESRFLRWAP